MMPDKKPTVNVLVDFLTGITFVLVKSGTFLMGIPDSEKIRDEDAPQHQVTLSNDFYIGKYEVTQRQWETVMGENPSQFEDCPDCPVENVNYFEIQEFIRRLNQQSNSKKGKKLHFRLPSEAEWEYACRAGTATAFTFGENLSTDQANYDGNYPYRQFGKGEYREKTALVGSFPPNAWGIHDMHGNVWEWCRDWYCEYPDSAVRDPLGQCSDGRKVIRGGSWYFNAESARSGRRYTHHPEDRGPSLGFRLVCVVGPIE